MFTLKSVYQEIFEGVYSSPVERKSSSEQQDEYIQLLGMFELFKTNKLKSYGALKQNTWLYVDDVDRKIKQELQNVKASQELYKKEKMADFFTSLEEMIKKENPDVDEKIKSEMYSYVDFSIIQLEKITEAK